MSARGRLLCVLVTIVVALAGFVTVGALPAAAAPGAVQYVALGDSYAAGTAIGSYPFCPHGDGGYPARLAVESRIVLQDNLACSGATTSAVIENQLPVLSDLNGETRLVTLTVGAANLDLASVLTACTAVPPVNCDAAIRQALSMLPMLGSALTEVYAAVAAAAPKARIVVTGYPHLLEPGNNPVFIAVNAAIDQLNTTIEQAVSVTNEADVNIHFVDVTEEFAGHGIFSPVPFIFAPPSTEAFHPNPLGYDAYADAISAALPGGWLKQKQVV
jgi:lysophospholipase L1-like esterase